MKYKSEMQISLIVIRCGRFAAIVYILCKLLSGIVLPYTAYAFQRLIDGIIFSFQNNAEMAVILGPLVMAASIYAFRAIEEPVENYCSFLISQRVGYFYEANNISKLSKMEYAHFENSSDVDLINRINESAGNAATDLFDNILNLISGTIKIVGTFMLLASYSFLLAAAVVFVAIPIIVLAAKYGKSIHDWYEKNSKKRRKLDYRSLLFIDRAASFEMKEYGHYGYLNSEWKIQSRELRLSDFKLQVKAWKNAIVSGLLLNLFEYATYFVMLLPTIGGNITIGAFVGLSKAISSIENLILWNFSQLFTFFARSKEYWKDYNAFLDLSEVPSAVRHLSIPDKSGCSIEFRGVSFKYPNMEEEVLKNVSFKIQPNELCGLVGINGAGKSTLSKLMLGLYEPTSGEILINGRNTKDIAFEERIGYFGITYQDFVKYNISVIDNMAFTLEPVDTVRAESILKSIGFDYENLPLGIDTIVGRLFGDGTDISGGEWQKLAIARMLFSDAPFFIMDEPTASLDPMSEIELYEQLQVALSNRTSLLITHRLGATVICDKIMVLDNGRIVETGTFSELLERGGIYAEMYNEQKQWYNK